jgi:hypothetical protein
MGHLADSFSNGQTVHVAAAFEMIRIRPIQQPGISALLETASTSIAQIETFEWRGRDEFSCDEMLRDEVVQDKRRADEIAQSVYPHTARGIVSHIKPWEERFINHEIMGFFPEDLVRAHGVIYMDRVKMTSHFRHALSLREPFVARFDFTEGCPVSEISSIIPLPNLAAHMVQLETASPQERLEIITGAVYASPLFTT